MKRTNFFIAITFTIIATIMLFTLGSFVKINSEAGNPTPRVTPSSVVSSTPTRTTPPVTSGPVQCPQVFQVEVGWGDKTNGLEVMAFLPDDLTVNVGDTIIFTQRTLEIHTVTFNAPDLLPDSFQSEPGGRIVFNPVVFFPSSTVSGSQTDTPAILSANFDGNGYLNSGVLANPGDSFSVTFTRQGTYNYVCLIHPDSMNGTITVNSVGTPYPARQLVYASYTALLLDEYQAMANDFLSKAIIPEPEVAADGSRTFTVYAGASDQDNNNIVMFMRFFGGENLTIKAGDSVKWDLSQNEAGTPHTITFLSGQEEPPLLIFEPQTSGPPKVVINPIVVAPAPATPAPYAGSGYFNSGLLITDMLTTFNTAQVYTLTFTTPGVYPYVCQVHDAEGMVGTITVTP